MTDTNDSAERSDGSAGSVGEPMAWALMQPDSYSVWPSIRIAHKMQTALAGGDVIPLYRRPQPTLTDAERLSIERAAIALEARDAVHGSKVAGNDAAVVRGLLDRLK